MLEYGKMYKCDRCLTECFMQRDGVTLGADPHEIYSGDMPDGWDKSCRGWHLCPACADAYNKMMDDFHQVYPI